MKIVNIDKDFESDIIKVLKVFPKYKGITPIELLYGRGKLRNLFAFSGKFEMILSEHLGD